MKRRQVNLRVWRISLRPSGQAIPIPIANFTKEEIEERLNEIYLPQVNIHFNVVKVHGDMNPLNQNWDVGLENENGTAGNTRLDIRPKDNNTKFGAEADFILDKWKDNTKKVDINVYFVGHHELFNGTAFGFADRAGRSVFVAAPDVPEMPIYPGDRTRGELLTSSLSDFKQGAGSKFFQAGLS